VAVVDQGGLGLPDREQYLKDDARSAQLRARYLAHVEHTVELLGDEPEAAQAAARAVMDVETALARVSLERAQTREPTRVYHRSRRKDLVRLAPDFAWDRYLAALSAPAFDDLNVAVPEFVKGFDDVVKTTSLDGIK